MAERGIEPTQLHFTLGLEEEQGTGKNKDCWAHERISEAQGSGWGMICRAQMEKDHQLDGILQSSSDMKFKVVASLSSNQ